MPGNPMTDADTNFLLEHFDPANPTREFRILIRRIVVLTEEKAQLEQVARDTQERLAKIEHLFKDGVFGVEPATLKWLAKTDEGKLKKIDAAIQFMDNAQFMGKWTWIGLAIIASIVSGIAGAYSWLKGVRL